MCKTTLRLAKSQDKVIFRNLLPYFIWLAAMIALTALNCTTSYYMITVPAMFITFLLIIPIFIIVYKRTAKYRNPVYTDTPVTFNVENDKVYMNGTKVTVRLIPASGGFLISTDWWNGYTVDPAQTNEFLTFLRLCDIPFVGSNLFDRQ